MKKRLVMGMMSAALIAGMVLPVHAEDNTTGGEMSVNYTQGNTYVISIPKSVTLQQGKETTAEQMNATSINLAPGAKVHVKVTEGITDGAVTLSLKNGETTDKVTSKVSLTSGGDVITENTVVAEFTGSGNDIEPTKGTGTLHFAALQDGMRAGEWEGKLEFSVSFVPAENTESTTE